jgi:SOS-response transcriptional repressor LexA
MRDLTKRQREVLRFISSFYDTNGYPVSRTEMVEGFGINRNAAQGHVDMLERKGMITLKPGAARSIVVTTKGKSEISIVKPFSKGKHSERPQAGELCARINALIAEYAGDLGTAEAIGVLEIVKNGLMK